MLLPSGPTVRGASRSMSFASIARWLEAGETRPLEPAIAERLSVAQFEAATRHSFAMLIANVGNAILIVIMAGLGSRLVLAAAWALVLAAFILPQVLKTKARRRRLRSGVVKPRTIRRLIRSAAILSAIWGMMPVLLLNSDPGQQFIISTVAIGMLCGGVFGFAAMPAAALAWLAPMTFGMALAVAFNATGKLYWLAEPLLLAYATVLLFGVSSHARSFAETVIARARAELAARHDSLTGLPNRTAFDASLAEGLLRCERFGERVSLFSIDFDHFKAVNDHWGHQAGDQLLRQAADRLRDTVHERGFIARLGGDEFSVIAPGLVTEREIETFASDIVACFDAPFLLDAGPTLCRASVGFATAPADGRDAATLTAAADACLYRAKFESRDSLPRRKGGDLVAAMHRRELTNDMRGALARGEFYLCYQPVMTLRGEVLHGFEALARWRHPRFGEIPPALFIEIAEKNGFIHELGEWILHEACREAAGWPESISIGVNVSGKQLCDAAFEGHFEHALAASGLPADRLQIEVTESASLAVQKEAERALRRMRARGAEIVLDDFGVGFSSFELIRRLPIGRLKVDRAFVGDLPEGREGAAVVESMVCLARALGLSVTAEGVETASQLAFLERAGCSEAQGYLIGPPLEAAQARVRIAALTPPPRRSAA